MKEYVIGVIGCGNMAGAIVRGMVGKEHIKPGSILLYDKVIEKADCLSKETGCRRGDLSNVVREANILLVAVKPHDLGGLLEEIAPGIKEQTVISIAAGIKIDTILKKIGKKVPVVRVMPNIAAFVSESITCVAHNDMASGVIEEVKTIFSGIGDVVEIEEELFDCVTALSGSGPAYLFYLANEMINAGVSLGLNEDTSKKLVRQTLFGASKLLKEGNVSSKELIAKVASKKGTTEAALEVFEAEGFGKILKNAITKAKTRSEEISGG